ncbi:hypothetical protein A2W24_02335 [Microgenomates group bacterium RBG_16_45_19]|nr:MAG: hypothetical protein A2W24_02335 [Microgenomates group bacterium RBG_16_45_19]
MLHYVCSGGCLTVQLKPGFCLVDGCHRNRNPLSLCDCLNGTHNEWLFRNHPDPENARAAAKSQLKKLPEKFQALTKPKPTKSKADKSLKPT